MALDTTNLTKFLKGITDAIRSKTGSTEPIEHKKIDEEINNIITFDQCTGSIKRLLQNSNKFTDWTRMFSSKIWTDDVFAKIGNCIDTSGGTRFNYMFANNKQITSTPELDISNVKTASDSFEDYGCVMMFYGCTNLVTINFKTNPVPTYYNYAFQDCSNLEIINGAFDWTKSKTYGVPTGGLIYMFAGCTKLKEIRFVENSIYMNCPDLHYTEVLSDESINSIVNGLAILPTTGKRTLYLNSKVVDRLTDEQLAIIANKNWELG